MKKVLILLSIALCCLTQAQAQIHFEQDLSWQQVQDKARAEHKFIFLDCFASWCGPCKMMERSVYSDAKVGEAFNAHFISFKLLMDRDTGDTGQLMKQYAIRAFPTYLFFSPEGRLVHRGLGFQPAADFIALGEAALDPKRQYETLLAGYGQGNSQPQELQVLALEARAMGETATAQQVAGDYIMLLLKLNEAAIFTPENIAFIGAFTQSSKDQGYAWFAAHTARIDILMKSPGYARDVIDQVIMAEEINPLLRQPPADWAKISAMVTQKHDALTADRTVCKAKIFSSYGKDWPAFTAAMVRYTEKYEDKHNSKVLDKNAHFILQYSKNKQELQSALSWTRLALEREPGNSSYQQTSAALQARLKTI
jgi:thioredoxin-related protein